MLRASVILLALACTFLTTVPLGSLGASEMTPEQRRAIEAIIHDYLMQNPDVLIEALRARASLCCFPLSSAACSD